MQGTRHKTFLNSNKIKNWFNFSNPKNFYFRSFQNSKEFQEQTFPSPPLSKNVQQQSNDKNS